MTTTPEAPLLAPAQAAALLDQVLDEQVLECVDLEALYRLEQSLILMLGELDGVACDRAGELARAMIDRALVRLPGDVRDYLRTGGWAPCHGCELCDDEPAQPGASADQER